MKDKNSDFPAEEMVKKKQQLDRVLYFVNQNFMNGFCKKANQGVSRMFFEALSVGVAGALYENDELKLSKKVNAGLWLKNYDFKILISGKYRSHSPEKIKQRIDFVKNKMLRL
jgi:hypothetical protein